MKNPTPLQGAIDAEHVAVPRRIKGHKLTLEWSGERGREASSTGTCICGWEESCSSQREVRREYWAHRRRVWLAWKEDTTWRV